MPWKQQGGPIADHQVLRGDIHPFCLQVADLCQQVFRVHRDAVAQDVHHALAENAGRQQMQREFAELVDHGVAGVAAALEADHDIVFLG